MLPEAVFRWHLVDMSAVQDAVIERVNQTLTVRILLKFCTVYKIITGAKLENDVDNYALTAFF